MVEGDVRTGGGAFIGRDQINNFFQTVVRNPSAWPDALWRLLVRHWIFLVVALVLLTALTDVYARYRDLYLIPTWAWALAAFSLLTAVWAGYTWRSNRQPARLAAGGLAAVALLGLLGWQGKQIVAPPQITRDAFGIAVAEFGEGADFRRTPRAARLPGKFTSICAITWCCTAWTNRATRSKAPNWCVSA